MVARKSLLGEVRCVESGIGRRVVMLGLSGLTSCSITQMAVETQADVMELASPVVEAQVDYEFARAAAPANLLQLEGLLRVKPTSAALLLLTARSWASYAYAFVEDEMLTAELAGEIERADHQRARARAMYLRAQELGLRRLEAEAPGVRASARKDPEQLRELLAKDFADEEWAPVLFWTGYAWGSAINLSRDDPALLADLPFATVLVEQSLALDERYFNAAAHVFLGVASASRGASVGGDPQGGKKHFERALSLTNREALMVQLNYAQSYAVQMQDRRLFDALLDEVTRETPLPGTPVSLANVLAQRRAQRLREQADELILPPPIPGSSGPPSPDAQTEKAGSRETS